MAGLYIHVPFCEKKCAYCDFYSIPGDLKDIVRFLEALENEIRLSAQQYSENHTLQTIYLGGGTPSLLTPLQTGRLLRSIGSVFTLATDAEISLEVNPGTITIEDFEGYRKARINRVSLGVQSFSDEDLKMLCRIHSGKAATDSVKSAKAAGFKNIGIDLIYGLPGQSVQQWHDVLQKTLELGVNHISTYALTWNESTPLGRKINNGELPAPTDETLSEMFLIADQVLTDAGFEHYEISNYAQPGYRCNHNENYWSGETYLGLGPSAHSYSHSTRIWNVSDIGAYYGVLCQNRLPIAGSERLNEAQKRLERIALGLRCSKGISIHLVEGQTSRISDLVQNGLAILRGENLHLTARGFLLADQITLDLAD